MDAGHRYGLALAGPAAAATAGPEGRHCQRRRQSARWPAGNVQCLVPEVGLLQRGQPAGAGQPDGYPAYAEPAPARHGNDGAGRTAGGARRIGNQYKSETRWQASEHWQWQLQLAWVDAGPALKQAGGQDTLFASIVGAWQW
ncbi:hypothetical protein G6F60_013579 [Rhizopus arrhizus]|nr:hypothetical protein G6F60_013579 [Rhizopus arrhizus]